jgi:hypothetical protein
MPEFISPKARRFGCFQAFSLPRPCPETPPTVPPKEQFPSPHQNDPIDRVFFWHFMAIGHNYPFETFASVLFP